MSRVIAVCTSDLHLCHRAPVARSAEPDWYLAMTRPLSELKHLTDKHKAPLVVAGDIFDRWDAGGGADNRKSSPAAELINFAISIFDEFNYGVYGIPGQHDLPNHRYDEMRRSAFYTLICSKRMELIEPGVPLRYDDLVLHAFPWGVPVTPLEEDPGEVIHLAVIHSYIWREGSSYPGADEAQHARQRIGSGSLRGYTASVWGDNHKGFMVGNTMMNCGTMMRRKSDEIEYKPHVGLLCDDGCIEEYFLDTSADRFLEESLCDGREEATADVSSFLDQLKTLQADPLNFREATNRMLEQRRLPNDSEVRRIVLDCLAVQR